MVRQPAHYSGVADNIAIQAFNGPASEAVLLKRGDVTVELCVALQPRQRTAGVAHYFGVLVQCRDASRSQSFQGRSLMRVVSPMRQFMNRRAPSEREYGSIEPFWMCRTIGLSRSH